VTGWSLTTCQAAGSLVAAVQRADGSYVIPDLLQRYAGLAEVLDDWAVISPRLRGLDMTGLPAVDARPVVTVRYPRKLIGVGANYHDHVAEMGAPPVPADAEPFFYFVPATTAMIGDREQILVPADSDALAVDWEAELAVVVGRGGRDIAPSDVLDHLAGYACYDDVTARGLMRKRSPLAEPFTWDWAVCKGLDTFCPMGPVTPAWMVPDPNDLGIRCLVNGVVKQDSSTREFIRTVQELVAAASKFWTLEPGDVIATGTPAGVGHPRGEHLVPGDEVRVEITGLAPLTNQVAVRRDGKSEGTGPANRAAAADRTFGQEITR
jgi:2-keto-4-pentenoate hydratase/2-oxohepta-3-ene-1,7-dioic acid hydratase in catechol pathway